MAPVGASANPNATLHPPFGHTAWVAGAASSTNCGTAHGAAARWNASTGLVSMASKASAHSCSAAFGQTYVQSAHWLRVSIPFHPTKVAHYNVSVTFAWKFASAAAVTTGPCPAAVNNSGGWAYTYCEWYASWQAFVDTSIWDASNQTVVSATTNLWTAFNSSITDVYNSCVFGSCSSSNRSGSSSGTHNSSTQDPSGESIFVYPSLGVAGGVVSLWSNTSGNYLNTSLLPGHSYALVMLVDLNAYVWENGYVNIYNGSSYLLSNLNPRGSEVASVSSVPGTSGLGIVVTSLKSTAV